MQKNRTADELNGTLVALSDPEIAQHSTRFFKSGPGEYGEGDRFLGVRVPAVRQVAARFKAMPLNEAETALQSEWHEIRLCTLIMLTLKFPRASTNEQRAIVDLYLANTHRINNWDLVDCSAHKILGEWLLSRDRDVLYRLVMSESLWERRISIFTTYWFIRQGQLDDTFKLAEQLLDDPEDLIHKASGWMLREAGKKDQVALEAFLDQHIRRMPRTMLRYAIEKLPAARRKHYMAL